MCALSFITGFAAGCIATLTAVWLGMCWLSRRMDADDRWVERGE